MSLAGICLLQAPYLVSESPMQFGLSESDCQYFLLLVLEQDGSEFVDVFTLCFKYFCEA